jgi:vanillate O-demethylase ferredoxin subunit
MSVNQAPVKVCVTRKAVEALDICSFELVAAANQSLPRFFAGSHIDVYLPNGVTRQYSLCNDPQDVNRYVIAVLREPASRGGSSNLHDLICEGDELQISGPRNNFPLADGARKSLLVAGGIGVTPILSMAERLAADGEPFEFHYCTRSRDRAAFRKRIENSSFAAQARFYYDDDQPSERLDIASLLANVGESVHLYVCGPTGFIDAVMTCARSAGWPESHLHYEFFSSVSLNSGEDTAFEVQIASSGQIVIVPPDCSATQALSAAGIEIATSCEQGVCGSCLTRVIEGVPDHRDVYLSPEEHAANDQFTPCCSRAKSPRLVLDL